MSSSVEGGSGSHTPLPSTVAGKLEYCARVREEANALFRGQEHRRAIVTYKKALPFLKSLAGGGGQAGLDGIVGLAAAARTGPASAPQDSLDPPQQAQLQEHSVAIHNNLALCYAKWADAENPSRLDKALEHVEEVLKVDPTNAKALYRKGEICFRKGYLDDALEEFRKVLEQDPQNQGASAYVATLEEELRRKQAARARAMQARLHDAVARQDEVDPDSEEDS